MTVDETGVDETGVDELGINHWVLPPLCPPRVNMTSLM